MASGRSCLSTILNRAPSGTHCHQHLAQAVAPALPRGRGLFPQRPPYTLSESPWRRVAVGGVLLARRPTTSPQGWVYGVAANCKPQPKAELDSCRCAAADAAAPRQCAGCRPRPTGRKAVAARPPCTLRRPDRAPASSPAVCPHWLTVATKSRPCALVALAAIRAARPSASAQPVPTIQVLTLALKRVSPYSAAAGET